jgi:hypothetical protein
MKKYVKHQELINNHKDINRNRFRHFCNKNNYKEWDIKDIFFNKDKIKNK